MKKLLAIIIMVIMALSVTACGSGQESTDSEPAQQAKTTGTPQPAENAATANDVLSGFFKLNGVEVALPCSIADIEATGLVVYEPEKDLDENTLTPINLTNKDGESTGISVYFFSKQACKAKDAQIYQIYYSYDDERNIPIEFAGGLTNESSYDEVKAKLEGDGSYEFYADENGISASIYEEPFFPNSVEVGFDQNAKIYSVSIRQLSSAASE